MFAAAGWLGGWCGLCGWRGSVLRVMVVASLFVGVNYVYFAIKRIREGC